jgi:hypothetical protein
VQRRSFVRKRSSRSVRRPLSASPQAIEPSTDGIARRRRPSAFADASADRRSLGEGWSEADRSWCTTLRPQALRREARHKSSPCGRRIRAPVGNIRLCIDCSARAAAHRPERLYLASIGGRR